jgi:hypothetical protein
MMNLLWLLVVGALVVIPFFRLLPQYGINPYWSVVAVVPAGLIILLWVMASRVPD